MSCMNISKPTDVCHPSHRLTNMTCEIMWDIVTPNGWTVKRSAGLRQWMTPYQASAAHVCQTLSLEALEEFPEFPCFSCNSTVRNLLTQNDPRWLKWYLFRRFWLKMTPAPRLPRFTQTTIFTKSNKVRSCRARRRQECQPFSGRQIPVSWLTLWRFFVTKLRPRWSAKNLHARL